MLVKDLIKKLNEYNPDADVSLAISEDITLSYICKDNDGNDLTQSTTKQVFIEPMDSCPTCVHGYIENDKRMCSFYQKPCRLVEECFQYEEFSDYDA